MPRTYATTSDGHAIVLITEHDNGNATVTETRWTLNARSGNASHPLTGHGTYHLRRHYAGEYGTMAGSTQSSNRVHIHDAAALAADWAAIAASAAFVHAMLRIDTNA